MSKLCKVNDDVFEKLKKSSSATISLVLYKRGIRSTYLKGISSLTKENDSFVAEAYTLRFIPFREDLNSPENIFSLAHNYPPKKVIELIPAGAALVMDCRGEESVVGVMGDILAERLKQRGCAAVIADAPIRDAEKLSSIGLPIFCTGAASPASLNSHFGIDFQQPIACGGVAVIPGDILVGDADGVVLIPRDIVADVAVEAYETEMLEEFIFERISEGASTVGLYPPNEDAMNSYEVYKASK